MSKTKKKIKSFNTHELKEKIIGDWIANTGVIFTILLILILNSKEGSLIYSIFSILDNINKFFWGILFLIFFLAPPIFTLISVFELSKENNFSKFNWSFWIMMTLCITLGITDYSIDYYTYVLFFSAYLINLYKIKNILKSLSYTFGQIPLVLISFLFIGTLINLFKRSFK